MTNIILCGGNGTRLWPISRSLMPKQFAKLFSKKSLFQLTYERNKKLFDKQLIVSNETQFFLASDQLEELHADSNSVSFLLEGAARNTAPAIGLACMSLDADEILLICPSDHLIKDEDAYEKRVLEAIEFAKNDFLVTFGIKPSYAETGYGYIEATNNDVKAFHEKPDIERAEKYLEAGNYYWNSGMFCFKASVFLEELQKYSPEIYSTCKEAYENRVAMGEAQTRITSEFMNAIAEDSIDYAVMEKSERVKVVPSDINWSDVGSFDALSQELPNDENNNFIISSKRTELIDVEDLIVVDTDDALLISKKGSTQKVKDVVAKLKKESSHLPNIHIEAHRPWGTYKILEDSDGYKIKKIVVKPGKRLSLQKHYHRNEHWIVVSGTATVTVGKETTLVRPNESTYIKMGEIHRLENGGKIPLVIIEAQVGEYTGEDDIVRIEDDFKREGK
ncbi:MAG: mannose-1-phosphate guanylyltransferase/mannose-6-phosphate isomerase [Campylobacterota bacterium]|nr:mannose-1-phosphate guanylyltransferase/mannose-6-phosphate isomerase [Campylobacterota bacterium]